jgi:hypothetical protein
MPSKKKSTEQGSENTNSPNPDHDVDLSAFFQRDNQSPKKTQGNVIMKDE